MTIRQRLSNIGPGALVAAAFIGPGTVTACTVAGAQFGYSLLWALLFATVATIILQEMAARLGVVTQLGLGEALRNTFSSSVWRLPLYVLIAVALYLGNSAYEAGNLSGAALGLQAIIGEEKWVYRASVFTISVIAGITLWLGSYRLIERVLLVIVCAMTLSFVATFVVVRPDITSMLSGLVIPKITSGSLMTIIALIGTTVVPYNLFLHASAAKSRWNSTEDLPRARADTSIAIALGGLVTILIASTAAASFFGLGISITTAGDMAAQLEPLFGKLSRVTLGIGLFAAGLTSSITAPLATAFAMTEISGMKGGASSLPFKLIATSVILIGTALALTGIKPVTIILSAQFANGLLLPIIAIFLLVVMNKKSLLGAYANSLWGNLMGVSVIGITTLLGARSVAKAVGLF